MGTRSIRRGKLKERFVSAMGEKRYFVIPLSVQPDGDAYLVGNQDLGDFYQFPEQGVKILDMLRAGNTAGAIRSRLSTEDPDVVDVNDFIGQLTAIGFIHTEDQQKSVQERLQAASRDGHRIFNVSPRIANAVFSPIALLMYGATFLYAIVLAIQSPQLRPNFDAFYIEANRTVLLLILLVLSVAQASLHEIGHMLAAACYGIRSRYGIGNRLWTIVAESDLTGILTLPRSQRYFPMLAGLLVDVVCASLLTILVGFLLRLGADAFIVQVAQALVLAIIIGIPWQFNIFLKTDIYFVICNYFGQSDLDRDARVYLRDVIHRITFGLFGTRTAVSGFQNVSLLRIFSLIWLFGRILSLLVLLGVFLPTMAQYIVSAAHMLTGPPTSVWLACDTIAYVSITVSVLGTGMYMWLKHS
jgi:putative peptide zinc metalloprotease protein